MVVNGVVYDSHIAPYMEYRCFPFNRLAFLYDLRIRNPFPTVSLRVHASYTEAVHDFCMSPFFSVNGRLRSCMFDLGVQRIVEKGNSRIDLTTFICLNSLVTSIIN